MKQKNNELKDVSIFSFLRSFANYASKNSLNGTGVSGFILKIQEIKDPELKKSLEASGIKVGDDVRWTYVF